MGEWMKGFMDGGCGAFEFGDVALVDDDSTPWARKCLAGLPLSQL